MQSVCKNLGYSICKTVLFINAANFLSREGIGNQFSADLLGQRVDGINFRFGALEANVCRGVAVRGAEFENKMRLPPLKNLEQRNYIVMTRSCRMIGQTQTIL